MFTLLCETETGRMPLVVAFTWDLDEPNLNVHVCVQKCVHVCIEAITSVRNRADQC
jgi:hypothetical protein